jgi:phosphonate transport system substrate-binding protein
MKAFITVITLIIIVSFSGCKDKAALNDKGIPKTLLIAVNAGEAPNLIKPMFVPIRKYLEKQLGMPVEMVFSTDYTAVIEALKSKKVHMAYISPFSYVIATRVTKLKPLVMLGANGKPSMYYSIIITGKNSTLKSMADVKVRSKSLNFCFVEPASASGHLIPRGYLNSIGIDPDKDFKQTIFAGGHLASVLSVKSGKVDVGATTKMVLGIMVDKGLIKKDDVNILWTSDAIVTEPIVVRSDLNADLAKKIQDAYLNMKTNDPKVLHDYITTFSKDHAEVSYMVAQDSFYNGLRKIAGGIKEMKQTANQ